MSDPKPDPEKTVDYCAGLLQNEILFSCITNGLAGLAILSAIALLGYRSCITTRNLETKTNLPPDDPEKLLSMSGTELKGIIDALKGLATSLKDAPASLVLTIVGLTLLFIPSTNLGSPCEDILKAKGQSLVTSVEQNETLKALLAKKPSSLTTVLENGKVTTKATWPTKAAAAPVD